MSAKLRLIYGHPPLQVYFVKLAKLLLLMAKKSTFCFWESVFHREGCYEALYRAGCTYCNRGVIFKF